MWTRGRQLCGISQLWPLAPDASCLSFLQFSVCSKLHLVDAVLLTHSDVAHLGALPYLVARHGLTARVFSTGTPHHLRSVRMHGTQPPAALSASTQISLAHAHNWPLQGVLWLPRWCQGPTCLPQGRLRVLCLHIVPRPGVRLLESKHFARMAGALKQ